MLFLVLSAILGVAQANKKCLGDVMGGYAACGKTALLVHNPGQKPSIFIGKTYHELKEHVAENHGEAARGLDMTMHAMVGTETHHFVVKNDDSLEKAMALANTLGVLLELELPMTGAPTAEPTNEPTPSPTSTPTMTPTNLPTAPPTPAPTVDCMYRYIRYMNVRVRAPSPNNRGATYGNHFCLYVVHFWDKKGRREPAKVIAFKPNKEDGNTYVKLTDNDVITDTNNDSHWCNYWGRWGLNEGWVTWDMGTQVVVDKYAIKAHHTWNYPSVWRLEGSNDNKSWVTISDVQEGRDFTMCRDCGLQSREFKTKC